MAEDAKELFKNLNELRVVDLKKELEKRSLSKSGSKKDLIDRLKAQLKVELNEDSEIAEVEVKAAPIEENEFVKNYLQEREKLLVKQMEQKKKFQEEANRSHESESQSETDESEQKTKSIPLPSGVTNKEEGRKPRSAAWEIIHEQINMPASKEVTIHDEKKDDHKQIKLQISDAKRSSFDGVDCSKEEPSEVASLNPSIVESSPAQKETLCIATQEQKDPENLPKRIPLRKHSESPTRKQSPPKVQSESPPRKQSDSPIQKRSESPLGKHSKSPVGKERKNSESPQRPSPGKRDRHSSSSSNSSSGTEPDERSMEQMKRSQRKQSNSGSESRHSRKQSSDSSSRSSTRSPSPKKKSRSRSESEDSQVPQKRSRSNSPVEDKQKARKSRSRSKSSNSSSRSRSRSMDDATKKQQPSDNESRHMVESSPAKEIIVPKDTTTTEQGSGEGFGKITSVEIEDKMDESVVSMSVPSNTDILSQPTNETKMEEDPVSKPARKRRWGAGSVTAARKSSVNISTDSLKGLIPEVKTDTKLPELTMEVEENSHDSSFDEVKEKREDAKEKIKPELTKQKSSEPSKPKISRTIFQTVKVDDEESLDEDPRKVEDPVRSKDDKENEKPAMKLKHTSSTDAKDSSNVDDDKKGVDLRRLSRTLSTNIQVDEPQAVSRRSPSPAHNLSSQFVHIHNLVRPYTLGQLKELLSHTGKLVEDGFWIDKIKSHCVVQYENVDEAIATRKSLHGKRWPLSNPKVLRVDYASQEEFDMFKNAKDGVAPARPVEKKEITTEKKKERDRGHDRVEEKIRKDLKKPGKEDKPKEKSPPPIREWDRDKIRQSRSRSHERIRRDAGKGLDRSKEKGDRSRDKSREERRKRRTSEEAKKEKVEEEPPAKLLDDLFRKTKAMPCIYWLPLTAEQIAEKIRIQQEIENERERRKNERERQLEEDREQRAKAREERAKDSRRGDDRDRRDRKRDGPKDRD